MIIKHRFIKCKHCKKEIEVFDDELITYREKICEYCGYENDLYFDMGVEIYYREF